MEYRFKSVLGVTFGLPKRRGSLPLLIGSTDHYSIVAWRVV